MPTTRRDFYRKSPQARGAWAELDNATNLAHNISQIRYTFDKSDLKGKSVLIIGAGVSGLTAAYELASSTSAKVTVLEAQNRTGGRCRTVRNGDTITEDVNSDLKSKPSDVTQVVRFSRPVGDSEPFLNAGPGRIPSTHVLLLDYMRQFNVPLEVYVMHSDSNLIHLKNSPLYGNDPIVARRLIYNMRGWLGEMVHQNAEQLLEDFYKRHHLGSVKNCDIENLKSFAESFGDLTVENKETGQEGGLYVVSSPDSGEDEQEDGSDRAGYSTIPGVQPGIVTKAIKLENLLSSQYWEKVNMYQQDDILWQPTLLHPTNGMDQVEKAFAEAAVVSGATIHLNHPVKRLSYNKSTKKYSVYTENNECFQSDYILCNIPMPFLQYIVDDDLININGNGGFEKEFKEALSAVFRTQDNEDETKRFLALTTKVGWQADRDLWQKSEVQDVQNSNVSVSNGQKIESRQSSRPTKKTQVGVVPIFGGISWTDDIITQIWYPSVAYHDKKGILTGAYNFDNNALEMGKMSIKQRLVAARAGAKLFGCEFAQGLENGVSIAWQNIPYIKGGWAQWHNVEGDNVNFFNEIQQGTSVEGQDNPTFFIIGDQVSSLPGWQEGAVAAALNAISRMSEPRFRLPYYKRLPDTRIIVEGLM